MSIAEKLQTIAENEQRVYETGYEKGKADSGDAEAAYNNGFEAGKQAELNGFWDSYQKNGDRSNYDYAFANWNADLFKPKYNIQPTACYMMFRGFNSHSPEAVDLVELLKKNGVTLDFSKLTGGFAYVFDNGCNVTRIGICDLRGATALTTSFQGCKAHTIDKIILKDDGSQTMQGSPFTSMVNLRNITFEGVIGVNFNIKNSPLTKESITSIINALSSTVSGKEATFSKQAVNNAFGSSTSEEWLNLIATKSNWTISLV